MRFKKLILLNILIITIMLTSCVRAREIEELGIVISTAIDMEDEEVVLTHEVIVPKSNTTSRSENEPDVLYIQSRGETIIDAIRNATLEFDRKLFLAHNRLIILGEDFAKNGIGHLMNFYVSDNEPRESAILVVAKDSKAYEIMGINGGLSSIAGKYLFDLLENYSLSLKTRDFTMNEFIRYYLQDENAVMSIAQELEELEVNRAEEKTIKSVLDVEGGAAFKKDKLIGYYNGNEMKGFNFIVDEFDNGLIIFEIPDDLIKDKKFRGSSGLKSVVEVKHSRTKTKVEIIDDKLVLLIDVSIRGTMIEDTKGLSISDNDMLEEVKLACSNRVKDYITMALDKAQNEFKVDSFSIGNLVHIKYPKLWSEISEDWEDIFPDLEYEIEVKTNLIRSGLINTPVNIKIDEERLKENK